MIFDCTVVPVRNGLPGSHGQSHKVFEKRVQELCSVNIEHAWESKKTLKKCLPETCCQHLPTHVQEDVFKTSAHATCPC